MKHERWCVALLIVAQLGCSEPGRARLDAGQAPPAIVRTRNEIYREIVSLFDQRAAEIRECIAQQMATTKVGFDVAALRVDGSGNILEVDYIETATSAATRHCLNLVLQTPRVSNPEESAARLRVPLTYLPIRTRP